MKKSEKSKSGWYFLILVLGLYVLTFFLDSEKLIPAFEFFINMLKNIIPVFILIFILMSLINYFITPQKIKKYIGKGNSVKSWFVAIVTGILSTGPIYMWYPMLRDLRDKGVSNGFVATFLYNRAIKIPLLPLIILYFGLKFTIILTILMIIFSIIQGMIIEKIGVEK